MKIGKQQSKKITESRSQGFVSSLKKDNPELIKRFKELSADEKNLISSELNKIENFYTYKTMDKVIASIRDGGEKGFIIQIDDMMYLPPNFYELSKIIVRQKIKPFIRSLKADKLDYFQPEDTVREMIESYLDWSLGEFIVRLDKKAKQIKTSTGQIAAKPRKSGWRECSRRLSQGCAGDLVKTLQRVLSRLDSKYKKMLGRAGVDGKFGPATRRAVRAFQKDAKIKVDGVVGPITLKALDKAINIKDLTPSPPIIKSPWD